MIVTFNYEIAGCYPVDVEIDEEELKEDGWYEMTEEEKINYIMEYYEYDAMRDVERECEFSIGALDYIQFDEKEHWMH